MIIAGVFLKAVGFVVAAIFFAGLLFGLFAARRR